MDSGTTDIYLPTESFEAVRNSFLEFFKVSDQIDSYDSSVVYYTILLFLWYRIPLSWIFLAAFGMESLNWHGAQLIFTLSSLSFQPFILDLLRIKVKTRSLHLL